MELAPPPSDVESPIKVPAATPWLRRALGLLLGVGSFYLLAIDQLSPHHLPGLRWIAFSVFAAGVMSVFLSTRFRRVEVAFCLTAVVLGLVAVGDVAMAGAKHSPSPSRAHASSGPHASK